MSASYLTGLHEQEPRLIWIGLTPGDPLWAVIGPDVWEFVFSPQSYQRTDSLRIWQRVNIVVGDPLPPASTDDNPRQRENVGRACAHGHRPKLRRYIDGHAQGHLLGLCQFLTDLPGPRFSRPDTVLLISRLGGLFRCFLTMPPASQNLHSRMIVCTCSHWVFWRVLVYHIRWLVTCWQ